MNEFDVTLGIQKIPGVFQQKHLYYNLFHIFTGTSLWVYGDHISLVDITFCLYSLYPKMNYRLFFFFVLGRPT